MWGQNGEECVSKHFFEYLLSFTSIMFMAIIFIGRKRKNKVNLNYFNCCHLLMKRVPSYPDFSVLSIDLLVVAFHHFTNAPFYIKKTLFAKPFGVFMPAT